MKRLTIFICLAILTVSTVAVVTSFSKSNIVPWVPGVDCEDTGDISDLIPPEGFYVDPGNYVETTCGLAMVGYRLDYGFDGDSPSYYCLYTACLTDRCYINQTTTGEE